MDAQGPSFPVSRHRREGGGGHVRAVRKNERERRQKGGVTREKEKVTLRAGLAVGRRGDGPGERRRGPAARGFSLLFHLINAQQRKTQKENERAKEKSYKNMIWTSWTFCDFPKLVWTNLKQVNSN